MIHHLTAHNEHNVSSKNINTIAQKGTYFAAAIDSLLLPKPDNISKYCALQVRGRLACKQLHVE